MGIRSRRYLIIGDGAAAITGARMLRQSDAGARITLVSDDPNPAYFRAALTNYLLGELREEQIWATTAHFYDQFRLERLHARAIGLDAGRAEVHLSHGGAPLSYDALLVASGARARAPDFEGRHLRCVMTLRTLQDCRSVMERVGSGTLRHSTVLGGGPLALEWALGMHARGVRVTVVLRGTTFMAGALDAVASDLLAARLRQAGIEVLLKDEVQVARDRGDGSVAAVRTKAGREFATDLVACAIGVVPNTEWLQNSGIRLGKGGAIPIDSRAQTSLPNVFAAGDVVEFEGRVLQLWEPAQTQARVAAHNMSGHPAEYAPGVHYMATRLFDLDFATLGEVVAPKGAEELHELPQGTGRISYQKVVLQNDRLIGALMLGQREAKVRTRGRLFKRLIDSRADVSLVKTRLLDDDFDLDAWLDQTALLHRDARPKNQGVAAAAQIRGTSVLDLSSLSLGAAAMAGRGNSKVAGTSNAGSRAGTAVLDRTAVPNSAAGSNGTAVLSSSAVLSSAAVAGTAAAPKVNFEAATQALGTQVLSAFNARSGSATSSPTLMDQKPVRAAGLLLANQRLPLNGRFARIGRAQDNEVVLADPSANLLHAHLEVALSDWYLRDIGSGGGTWVNGKSLNVPKRLETGDRIRIGNSELVFFFEDEEEHVAAVASQAQASGAPRPRFEIRSGRSLGLTFVLSSNPTRIGADPSCPLWLSDNGVSGQHAQAQWIGNAWHLVSHVPATTYNGVPVAIGQAVPLKERDRVTLGEVLMMYTQTPMAGELPAQSVASAPVPTGQRARMQAFSAVSVANPQRFLRMRVEQGPGAGDSVRLTDVCLLGSGAQCQLRLKDPSVSEVHVEVRLHEGAFWCRAFAPCSRNESALTQDFQKTAPGERFRIGSTVIVIEEALE